MAAAIRQQVFVDGAGNATTIAATFGSSVLAGSTIVVYVSCTGAATDPTYTVADGVNAGNYPAPIDNVLASADLDRVRCTVLQNSAAGVTTVTVTFSASIDFRSICIVEVTGLQAASLGQHTAALQTAPTTGANATTSGTSGTLTSQPNIILGFSFNTGGTGTPAVGTGYTAASGTSTGWGFGGTALARLEFKNTSATTAVAATFTAAGNTGHVTFVLALLETPAAAGQVPVSARTRLDAAEETFPARRSTVAAILAPAPAAPDTVLRPARRAWLDSDDTAAPRARVLIAAIIAAATPSPVLRPPPRQPVDIEQEQPSPRTRPQIAAVIWTPDTVLCPPASGGVPEDPEYLPRWRPMVAAILAGPVVADMPRPPRRQIPPQEDDALPPRRPGIAAVTGPDTVLRPLRQQTFEEPDALPGRRPAIAAILASPIAAYQPRPQPRAALPDDEAPLPARRVGIAAVLPGPDTVLRPPQPRALNPDDEASPQRRTTVAAVLAAQPAAADTVLRPGRRVDLPSDETQPVRPRPGIAALLAPTPPADAPVPRTRTSPASWHDETSPPARRPGIAAVLSAPPPDTVLRPARAVVLLPDDVAPARSRPQVAAILAVPDFVLRAPARTTLADPDEPIDRRPRQIAALLAPQPASAPVPRNQRQAIDAVEEWQTPTRRPGIAAVLAPAPAAPDTVLRPLSRQAVIQALWMPEPALPRRVPSVAAVTAPPPVDGPSLATVDLDLTATAGSTGTTGFGIFPTSMGVPTSDDDG